MGSARWFGYVAATKTFRVANVTGNRDVATANPVISFGAAERVAASSNARQTAYKTTVAGYDYDLTLFNPGAGNDLLALTYSSLGLTRQTMSGALATYPSYTVQVSHAFAYGIVTPSSAVPPSGAVTYHGVVMGEATYLSSNPSQVYRISGTISVTVNFASGTNNGTLALVGTDDRTGAQVNLGNFEFTLNSDGALTGNGAGSASGNAGFAYYGPGAEELSGAAGIQITGSPLLSSTNGNLSLSFAFGTKR